jgi:hypothetical protein
MQVTQANEAIRITLTITICMILGKVLNFNSVVYLALYPTIVMTKSKDYSWKGIFVTLAPACVSATMAVVVSELFQDHPFIIWTISLIFFDQLRRRADTPPKLGRMLMPCFNWILIMVFAQSGAFNMPGMVRESFCAILITALVTKLMITLFPLPKLGKLPQFKPQPVTYGHRLVSLTLIGSGLGLLMIVDLLPATFCLVPVIAAATQFDRAKFIEVIELRFVTQIGGCAVAGLFILLMAGHQSTLGFYALVLGGTIYLIVRAMVSATGPARDIHADALLATVLPIQLYMGNNTFGLDSTFLRAWQLFITLCILFALHQLTFSRDKHEQANLPGPRSG